MALICNCPTDTTRCFSKAKNGSEEGGCVVVNQTEWQAFLNDVDGVSDSIIGLDFLISA